MKKLSITLALVALFTFGINYQNAFAQEDAATEEVAVEIVEEVA